MNKTKIGIFGGVVWAFVQRERWIFPLVSVAAVLYSLALFGIAVSRENPLFVQAMVAHVRGD